MNESDYDPDDPDFCHPLNEHNWWSQTRGRFMKDVIYTLSEGTESRPMSNQKQKIGRFQESDKKGGNCLSYTQG